MELDGKERRGEDPEDIDLKFKNILNKALHNFRIEHGIILALAILIIWAIIDRKSLVAMCNDYWLSKLKECYTPIKVTFP